MHREAHTLILLVSKLRRTVPPRGRGPGKSGLPFLTRSALFVNHPELIIVLDPPRKDRGLRPLAFTAPGGLARPLCRCSPPMLRVEVAHGLLQERVHLLGATGESGVRVDPCCLILAAVGLFGPALPGLCVLRLFRLYLGQDLPGLHLLQLGVGQRVVVDVVLDHLPLEQVDGHIQPALGALVLLLLLELLHLRRRLPLLRAEPDVPVVEVVPLIIDDAGPRLLLSELEHLLAPRDGVQMALHVRAPLPVQLAPADPPDERLAGDRPVG
mmetsp:Transcript_7910/g.19395  ORF Transcript_7910/g.19395 Transcript_7910/m.19395 type:complete len:269 (+) Transcript_7910:656-1462(+)